MWAFKKYCFNNNYTNNYTKTWIYFFIVFFNILNIVIRSLKTITVFFYLFSSQTNGLKSCKTLQTLKNDVKHFVLSFLFSMSAYHIIFPYKKWAKYELSSVLTSFFDSSKANSTFPLWFVWNFFFKFFKMRIFYEINYRFNL